MLTVAIPKRNKLQNIIVLTPKDGVLYPVKDGVLEITLPPRGAAVLTAERKIQPDFRLK